MFVGAWPPVGAHPNAAWLCLSSGSAPCAYFAENHQSEDYSNLAMYGLDDRVDRIVTGRNRSVKYFRDPWFGGYLGCVPGDVSRSVRGLGVSSVQTEMRGDCNW